ncbi:MAG: penicillin-binding protein 1A [Rhizobiales bacterium]|nr:penicillin-binding protein 1A [Hyphomicrobiales bacterium]NRB12954.1 penicillin-binding protein 1A [Hyphomicrobiales bacterium]
MLWRIFSSIFAILFLFLIVGLAAASYIIWEASKDLPDHTKLQAYEPNVMSRMHAANGQLLAEYAEQRRLYIPFESIPQRTVQAFISAEDKNFFTHPGIDSLAFARAMYTNVKNLGSGKRLIGASTITQQVAKNFLLSDEYTYTRKIKEALVTFRIESAYSKGKILELYLNEINLGLRSYGVAAASLNYFGKTLDKISIAQTAYLAALPKAPNNYHPFRHTERAITRRNWVVGRMFENGYITRDEMIEAQGEPLNVNPRPFGARIFAAEYFAEDVRRKVIELYGNKKLLRGGLSIRTTLDPTMQAQARNALVNGMVRYNRKNGGWRGPVAQIELSDNWAEDLTKIDRPSDIKPWRLAVVLEMNKSDVKIGLRPNINTAGEVEAIRETGTIKFAEVKWARPALEKGGVGRQPRKISDVLSAGDVIYVEPGASSEEFRLMQIPIISGGIVAMDPHTGRIQALVGGFSYEMSQFNRASQAERQPGSSFKPFVYAVALEHGYTPSSLILDAPYEKKIVGQNTIWKPQNYSKKFYGPSTLRLGIEKSRNVMTVRLAEDISMPIISKYATEFGVYEKLNPYLSMALGSGETTVVKMVTGYSVLANGGIQVTPTLIDRIQDRYGRTIYRHDKRECTSCFADEWLGQEEPNLIDTSKRVISATTAYQITSFMEGVVLRGTAPVVRKLGKPVAGKTGTTNDYKDAWFVGYTPDLVVGVYLGFDTPKNMGRSQTGGQLAAPVFLDFMQQALKDTPAIPFRVPNGLNFYRIDGKTGIAAMPGDENIITEAFKNGAEPPEEALEFDDSIDNLDEIEISLEDLGIGSNDATFGINNNLFSNDGGLGIENSIELDLSLDSDEGTIF